MNPAAGNTAPLLHGMAEEHSSPPVSPVAALTRRLAAGEEAAFAEFHAAWAARLFRYVRVLLRGDEHAARDVWQETLVRVVRHARPLPDERALWDWLARLARCAAADHGRKGSRYRRLLWWQDALDDPLPPELTARSLDAMCAEARRRRQQRRRRIVGGTGVLVAVVLIQVRWRFQPKAEKLRPPVVAVLPAKPPPAPSVAPAAVASVRYIDDKELAARLGNMGVVTAGNGAARRVLLVAADGQVYPP